MKLRAPRAPVDNAGSPEQMLQSMQAFLDGCRRPAVLEYGEEPISLKPGEYTLEVRAGRLGFEVWDDTRCISRLILAVERISGAVLDCSVQRFGGKTGKLTLLDLDRPQAAHRCQTGSRHSFAEKFRRTLSRQFPGWMVAALSTGPDLQRSFSPTLPRARLTRGTHTVAAMACPAKELEPALLTFALVWHDYIHLPLQALDYWMRIRWHAERGELQHLFPAIPLSGLPPKLLLVAPAMAFHPSTESVLRYFASDIEVERVGVNTEWQNRLQVVLRLHGSDVPVSHRSFE
jgi:hypothetical protein